MEYFNLDMAGLISDQYREASAFGSKVTFPYEEVPVCQETIIKKH